MSRAYGLRVRASFSLGRKRLKYDLVIILKYFVIVCKKNKFHIFHIALDCQGPVSEN